MNTSVGLHPWPLPAAPAAPRHWLRRGRQLWARCAARRRQRLALAALDARLLRDIGLTPDQARAEAAKPFWRA